MKCIPALSIRGRSGGNNGKLLQAALVLSSVDGSEDDGTVGAVASAKVKAESPALGEALRLQVVDQEGVLGVTSQVRTDTEDTERNVLAGVRNTEHLVLDRGRCESDLVSFVS